MPSDHTSKFPSKLKKGSEGNVREPYEGKSEWVLYEYHTVTRGRGGDGSSGTLCFVLASIFRMLSFFVGRAVGY